MKMNDRTKGILLAVAASAAIATANVSVNYFLKFTNPESMAIIWYLPTVVAAAMILLWKKSLVSEVKKYWKQGLALGIIYFFAAVFWFNSVNMIGAELTGFLTRFETVFAVMLAVIFLKERLNRVEILGIAIAVMGTLIISYSGGSYASLGSVVALLASLAIGIHILVAKVLVKSISPITMAGFRNFFAILLLLAYVLAFKEFKLISLGFMPLLVPLSLLSSLLGFYLLYTSLKHLDAAKVGALRVLDPAFILVYALLFFQTIPTAKDLVGGLMIMAGVAAMSLSRKQAKL